jgi:hypothetical protein
MLDAWNRAEHYRDLAEECRRLAAIHALDLLGADQPVKGPGLSCYGRFWSPPRFAVRSTDRRRRCPPNDPTQPVGRSVARRSFWPCRAAKSPESFCDPW